MCLGCCFVLLRSLGHLLYWSAEVFKVLFLFHFFNYLITYSLLQFIFGSFIFCNRKIGIINLQKLFLRFDVTEAQMIIMATLTITALLGSEIWTLTV